jgi:hypothetical protein
MSYDPLDIRGLRKLRGVIIYYSVKMVKEDWGRTTCLLWRNVLLETGIVIYYCLEGVPILNQKQSLYSTRKGEGG